MLSRGVYGHVSMVEKVVADAIRETELVGGFARCLEVALAAAKQNMHTVRLNCTNCNFPLSAVPV